MWDKYNYDFGNVDENTWIATSFTAKEVPTSAIPSCGCVLPTIDGKTLHVKLKTKDLGFRNEMPLDYSISVKVGDKYDILKLTGKVVKL